MKLRDSTNISCSNSNTKFAPDSCVYAKYAPEVEPHNHGIGMIRTKHGRAKEDDFQ